LELKKNLPRKNCLQRDRLFFATLL
jgi:hypothetical protein